MKKLIVSFGCILLLCSLKPPKKGGNGPQGDVLYTKYGGDVNKMMEDMRKQDSLKYPFLYNIQQEEKKDTVVTIDDETKILDYADELPKFTNGTQGINDYIQSYKLTIPDSLINEKANLEVKFYVNTIGTTRDPVVIKTDNPKFDAFTRWMIYDMPSWTPAKQNGKEVNCYVTLKVTYGK